MKRMAALRHLSRLLVGRRSRIAGPRVIVATDEQGRVTVMPAPESVEFWRQCPWAGDDEESVAFRRVMEQKLG
jgi:hypothetical protein